MSRMAPCRRKKLPYRGIFDDQVAGQGDVTCALDGLRVTCTVPRLPAGDSELYSHPSLDEFKNEFEALISPRVKGLVQQLGIQLIRYQDL